MSNPFSRYCHSFHYSPLLLSFFPPCLLSYFPLLSLLSLFILSFFHLYCLFSSSSSPPPTVSSHLFLLQLILPLLILPSFPLSSLFLLILPSLLFLHITGMSFQGFKSCTGKPPTSHATVLTILSKKIAGYSRKKGGVVGVNGKENGVIVAADMSMFEPSGDAQVTFRSALWGVSKMDKEAPSVRAVLKVCTYSKMIAVVLFYQSCNVFFDLLSTHLFPLLLSYLSSPHLTSHLLSSIPLSSYLSSPILSSP